MAAAAAACAVCTDAFNKRARRETRCCYCEYAACSACVQRFLLTTVQDPHCMSCRRGWSAEFIDTIMTRAFRTGDLRKHRENVLMERERSLLPATLPYVEAQLRDERYQARLRELSAELTALHLRIARCETRRQVVGRMDPTNVPEEYDDVDGYAEQDGAARQAAAPRAAFVKPCPTDGCRGFLSTAYKCSLCSTRLCPDCHEVLGAHEHACNPEVVASVRAIASDSRACPKCGVMIFRVSGCDQMYCTMPGCGTAFSFGTGLVVTGHIHNPHYYEFLRRNGGEVPREPGDDPMLACEGIPPLAMLMRVRVPIPTADQRRMFQTLQSVHMFAMHVQEVELHTYADYQRDAVSANRDLRVRFMRNQLEESEFKKTIVRREKRRLFNSDVHAILTMVVAVTGDEFRALLRDYTPEAVANMMRSMNQLRDYVNTNLRAIAARYNYTVPIVLGTWSMGRENP